MRYPDAWSSVLDQIQTQKFTVLSLSFLLVLATLALLFLANKEPLIFERECFTTVAKIGSQEPSQNEIERFVRDVLLDRFDSSKTSNSALLSHVQSLTIEKEFDELRKKGLSQKVLINDVKIGQEWIEIDADRVLGTDELKSIFRFPLRAKIRRTERTKPNPYGLILEHVEQLNLEKKDKQ